MMRFIAGDVIAEMRDAPRPFNVSQHEGLAGLEHAPIVILPGGVSGGNPVRLEVVQGGQAVQGEVLALDRQPGGKKSCQEDACIHRASLLKANGGSKGRGSCGFCRWA